MRRSEAGFTLIEVVVAAFVLIVGVMGTFLLLDSSTRALGTSRAREGATGIAREVLEQARLTAYSQLDTPAVVAVAQGLPGYQSTSGTTVTVVRRNTTYTVTPTVCSVDDPKDGYGDHTIGTWCSDSGTTGTTDAEPDDLKRVTVAIAWTAPRPGSLKQTMTLSSSGQGVGPPTQSFTMDSPTGTGANPSAPVISTSSTAAGGCASGSACFTASSTGAQKIIFAVDGTDQPESATPPGAAPDSSCTNYPATPCGKWHLTWSLNGLSDGAYRVTARAVDTSGIQGPPSTIMVNLNRGITATVCGVGSPSGTCLPIAGGYNTIGVAGTPTTVTEFQWQANSQRNVIGYEVDNPSGTPVCTTSMQSDTPTSCIDFNPPAPSTSPVTYTVYALYTDPNGNTAKGQGATVTFTGASASTTTTTTTFGFDPTTTNVSAGCPSAGAGGSQADLVSAFAGSAAYSQFGGSNSSTKTIVFCSPPLPAGTLTGQVSVASLFNLNAASSNKTCNVAWSLSHNGGTQTIASGTGVANGGGDHYTPITGTQAISGTAVPASDQLALALSMSGNNCSSTNLYYGGTSSTVPSGYPQPGSLTVTEQVPTTNPWPRPSPPTGVTATASGGQTNVSWTAPSGSVAFYRIYRDGQNYDQRVDTCEPGDNYCDQGSNKFTWVDYSPGGTTHTYYVTAVGLTTTTPNVPTMAESAFSAGATG